MSEQRPASRLSARSVVIAVALAAAALPASAQDSVTIQVPIGVSFQVSDVSRSSNGSPESSTLSFSSANLTGGHVLRVSLQADAAAFTPPSGAGIPASKVTWTAFSATGGTAFNGTVGSSAYNLVFQSAPTATSGQVDLTWSLAAPGSGTRAGSHQLAIRWKVESITP